LLTGKVVLRNSGSLRVAFTRSDSEVELTRLRSLEGLVLGCNLAIRREAVLRVKGCDTRIGPGTGLGGQDIDLAYRVLRAGYKGRFSPGPLVFHDPASRERSRDYLRGWGAFYMKFLLYGDFYVARKAWWEICRIFRDLGRGRRTGTSSPLREMSQMLLGALIMLRRTLLVSAILRPRKVSS
jgi:GT2 family glycosyltransferase